MRTRNKKIVLVESLNTHQPQSQSKFIEQNDATIPMRIYQHQAEDQGHLAEIFYEALLNQTINKKTTNLMQTYRSTNSNTLQTEVSEKRLNAGKIIRRSLSKNCSISSTPQKNKEQPSEREPLVMDSAIRKDFGGKNTNARAGNKQNNKISASRDKSIASSRRSISNKKELKYKVSTNIRS